jgi:hypothetical protein
MKENARQGFWNGATAPLGYKVVEAEKRGTKIKKKLEVDAVEPETVWLIFRLYLHGDGSTGALGVKEGSGRALRQRSPRRSMSPRRPRLFRLPLPGRANRCCTDRSWVSRGAGRTRLEAGVHAATFRSFDGGRVSQNIDP